MSPQEIQDAYEVVIKDIQDQNAERAAAIGNSQRSLGPLAEKVASPSGQTYGLANYTYNRTMRPTVDSLSASLTTNGKAAALENILKTKLRDAKNNYEDAKNAYTVASTTPKTSNPSSNPYSETEDPSLGQGKRKDESTGDPSSPGSTANNSTQADPYPTSALTGGGQVRGLPTGTKFSYKLNGSTHYGYVYPGEGGEVDGFSFTKEGLSNYLNGKVSNGATIQNYLGRDVDYSIWRLQHKI